MFWHSAHDPAPGSPRRSRSTRASATHRAVASSCPWPINALTRAACLRCSPSASMAEGWCLAGDGAGKPHGASAGPSGGRAAAPAVPVAATVNAATSAPGRRQVERMARPLPARSISTPCRSRARRTCFVVKPRAASSANTSRLWRGPPASMSRRSASHVGSWARISCCTAGALGVHGSARGGLALGVRRKP